MHPCDRGNNGGCAQKCVREEDKRSCACNDGYVLELNGVSCRKGLMKFIISLSMGVREIHRHT